MSSPESDSDLSRLLAHWRLAPTRDPQFRAGVWAALGARRGAATWPGFARAHLAVLTGALALAVVAGAWAGRVEARARVAASRDAIARSYVASLDARVMRLP